MIHRKKAEESLRESEQKHRTLCETIADGILIAEIETKKFNYANPAMCDMLGRTTDRIIRKELGFGPKEFCVHGNSDDLHRVLLHLGTNAFHAREEKGLSSEKFIRVEADRYHNADETDRTGLPKGNYVHLSFVGNGAGMTDEVRKRAFDPLYSTKQKGRRKGQGLGLAMVFNIVRKENGRIYIESDRGRGTTFHVYLPEGNPVGQSVMKGTDGLGGDETILVIEDEDAVRGLAEKILRGKRDTVYCF